MAEIRIVRDYPHPPEKVWRALTDPALIPRWTATGAGGRAGGRKASRPPSAPSSGTSPSPSPAGAESSSAR
jgi:uncharacterized protein YndB with AHSA1/START domain